MKNHKIGPHENKSPQQSKIEKIDPKIKSNQIIQNIIKNDLQNRLDISLIS